MPKKTRSKLPAPAPEVMTWAKAAPFLAISAVFDAVRFMFDWFVFFGPALAGLFCTYLVSSSSTFATSLGAIGCGAGAAVIGTAAAPALETFGIIMAMATALVGWLVLGLLLLLKNRRIYKENLFAFALSLLVGEIPIINSVPVMTIVLWRMYRRQIIAEKAAYAKWKAEEEARLRQEAAERAALELEAANDAAYGANDEERGDEEIPEQLPRAA